MYVYKKDGKATKSRFDSTPLTGWEQSLSYLHIIILIFVIKLHVAGKYITFYYNFSLFAPHKEMMRILLVKKMR